MTPNSFNSNGLKKILIPRITQLDANEFDNELHKILSNQIFEIANVFKPGCLSSIRSEITFFLNLFVFNFSILKNNSTFGQDLLGLKYSGSFNRYKAFFYVLLKYFLPYLQAKYEDNSGKIESPKVINYIKKVELFIKFSQLFNMLIFLKEGKYPTLTDRLLRLKYMPTNNFNRSVGYSFMIRQLLWHGFMELFTHIIPLINYKAIKRWFRITLYQNSCSKKIKMQIKQDAQTRCAICHELPNLPCLISIYCPHLACYYCIRSNILIDEKFLCPECDEPNTVSKKIIFL